MTLNKLCPGCRTLRPMEMWHRSKSRRDGLQVYCRDCHRAMIYRWRTKNKERFQEMHRRTMRVVMQRRQSAVKSSWPTPLQWDNVQRHWGAKCAYCDSPGPLSVDHVVPVAHGGALIPENLVPACRRCNSRKGTRELRAWLQDEDRYQFVMDMLSLSPD